jgi:adenylate cyclase
VKGVPGFLADLKRRHIYRVAAVYAVVAWVLIQLVGNLTPMLRLPEWAGSFVFVLLLVGLPLALIFAWIQEPSAAPATATDVAPAVTTKLDWVLAGGVAVVIAGILYQSVVGSPNEVQAVLRTVPQDGVISIAVLPLANLSGDSGQEYLSDGLTDEINAVLAKVPSLRVVGRSSAFQFKGQRTDLRAIGESLGATHLIDGSLRRAGDRVRVTAQLIRAADGIELWTETYNHELTDALGLQEEIAVAIAAELRAPLGLAEGQRLISTRPVNVESYENFLRGRALVRRRALAEAIVALEAAVEGDPEFAPAWAMLAQARRTTIEYSPLSRRVDVPIAEAREFIQTTLEQAERAARRAIELDPGHDGGYAALAYIQATRGHYAEADDLFAQALEIDPNNPESLYRHGQHLTLTGRIAEATRAFQRLSALEPLVPIYQFQMGNTLYLSGRNQASISVLEATPDDSPARYYRNFYLAASLSATGRYADAAAALLAVRGEPQTGAEITDFVADLLQRMPLRVESPANLPYAGDFSFVYVYVGAEERAFEGAERSLQVGNAASLLTNVWSPLFHDVRRTERFKKLVRDFGLVDYWRAHGWPDLCVPQGETDFVCD